MLMESKMSHMDNSRRKLIVENAAFFIFRLLSGVIVTVLFIILAFIIIKGIKVVNWDFLTTYPTDGMKAGGIYPAIVGTFCLMAGSAVFAFPLGIMSGIYMHEYASNGRLIKFIRMMTNNLSGIPSIVFGLFGMSLFVNYLGFGDSIIAGSLTLGLLALPLVIRTTEEALKAIPDSYREGSLALGATKLQTIRKVILPMAMPNIITGLILALGRVSGETAPILFTCAAYIALSSLCARHQRNGYGEADTDSIRHGTCADSDCFHHKHNGKRNEKLFPEQTQDQLMFAGRNKG